MLNSIYEPLGFLAPVMLTGKGILQKLYKLICGWEEEVPTNFEEKWKEWLKDLDLIYNFQEIHVQEML